MATLGITTLSGCNSIPSFIASGSKMIFRNATTPVSWTKDTTVNQGMLRVINGVTLSPGGSLTFPQVFTGPKSYSAPIGLSGVSFPGNLPLVNATSPTTTSTDSALAQTAVQPTTLTTPQLVAHTHPYITPNPGPTVTALFQATDPIAPTTSASAGTFQPAGGDLAHNHSISSAGPHFHQATVSGQHTHTIAFPQQHNHTVSAPQLTTGPFAVSYTDIIIATKD